jgi:hypothetical protein
MTDPDGPKTYGSYGSGSKKLVLSTYRIRTVLAAKWQAHHFTRNPSIAALLVRYHALSTLSASQGRDAARTL